MALPDEKFLAPKTDVEEAFGETEAPLEWVQRDAHPGAGIDTVRTTRMPTANGSNEPTPKVADVEGEAVTGTRFGPNSRGYPNTLSHNDEWHDAPFGDKGKS